MNNFKQIVERVQRSGLVLVDQAFVSGTSFLTGILLTRFLGLKAYGTFVLLWMVVLLGLSVAQALVTKPMLSIGPKLEEAASTQYNRALHGFQLLFSALSVLLSIICLTILSQFESFAILNISTIISLSVALGLILLYDFYRKLFFLKSEVESALWTDAILAGVQIVGICLLYKNDWLSIPIFLSLLVGAYSIVCLLNFWKIEFPDFSHRAISDIISKHFDFSKWLVGTVALQWLNGNFFIICAGGILGTAAVGAVRIAQNIIGLTHVIFLAMENVVPVSAAKAYKDGGYKGLLSFLKISSMQIGWFVMAILIFISGLAPQILKLLYGAEYMPYSYILISFCVIYLLVYTAYPLRFALRTLELTRPIFIAYTISAIFSVIAASPMIEAWGIYGLLIGLFVSQLITQTVYVIALWKTKGIYENHSLGTR